MSTVTSTSTDASYDQSTDELIELLRVTKSQQAGDKSPLTLIRGSDESNNTDRIVKALREIKLSQASKTVEEGTRCEISCSGFTTPPDVEISEDMMEKLSVESKHVGSSSDNGNGSTSFYGHKPSMNSKRITRRRTCPIKRVIPAVCGTSSESEGYGVEAGDKMEGFDEQAYQNEPKKDEEEDGLERMEPREAFGEWGECGVCDEMVGC
jgi:hypothetical protein